MLSFFFVACTQNIPSPVYRLSLCIFCLPFAWCWTSLDVGDIGYTYVEAKMIHTFRRQSPIFAMGSTSFLTISPISIQSQNVLETMDSQTFVFNCHLLTKPNWAFVQLQILIQNDSNHFFIVIKFFNNKAKDNFSLMYFYTVPHIWNIRLPPWTFWSYRTSSTPVVEAVAHSTSKFFNPSAAREFIRKSDFQLLKNCNPVLPAFPIGIKAGKQTTLMES